MSGNQRKYEYLASVCDALAQSASTPEQRETFVDLAHKWRAIATNQKPYEVPIATYRSAIKAWLHGLHR